MKAVSWGFPTLLTERHPFPGPGLAMGFICAAQPQESDYGETEVLSKLVVQYKDLLDKNHALLNRIENKASEKDMAVTGGGHQG